MHTAEASTVQRQCMTAEMTREAQWPKAWGGSLFIFVCFLLSRFYLRISV